MSCAKQEELHEHELESEHEHELESEHEHEFESDLNHRLLNFHHAYKHAPGKLAHIAFELQRERAHEYIGG